jgi:hypothetical protein
MTRVVWDAPGERLYHTGVDRGMLYIDDAIPIAVPWNGLASVTESPSGASSQPFYVDGQKVLNIASGEDFGASIEAYSAPLEFAPCAGRLRLSTALFLADQPRKPFGFSYRTLVGNDSMGTDYAYKIHVVYNALAAISDYAHTSRTDKSTAKTHSWAITTTPMFVQGYKPTSHFVFDTRFNGGRLVTELENILYGDDTHAPRLPTVDELAGFLATVGVVWWDLTGLPDFPGGSDRGDLGVYFDTGILYTYSLPVVASAYWWDLTDLDDFPLEAEVGDWGLYRDTGDVYKKTG